MNTTPPVISFWVYAEHQIRTARMPNGEVWFVAIDVARILRYRDTNNMIRDLRERERLNLPLDENSPDIIRAVRAEIARSPDTTLINISGLFKAIFNSRRPEAEAFTDWVTGSLLPALFLPEHALSVPKMRVAFRAYVLDVDREHREAGIDRVPEPWFGQEFPGVVVRQFPEWIRALLGLAGHAEYHTWKKQETPKRKLRPGDDPRQIEFPFTIGRGKRERTVEAANATADEVRYQQRAETAKRDGMRRRAAHLWLRWNSTHPETAIPPTEIAEISPDIGPNPELLLETRPDDPEEEIQ